METFAFASAVRGYHVFQDLFKPSIREKLVVSQHHGQTCCERVMKRSGQVLPYSVVFSCTCGEIRVEVIGRRQWRRMEVPWQSEQSTNETLERTTGEQELGLEPS